MYPPLNLKEVRHKYRQCDCGQLGLFQFGHDKPHAITPFAQAESPLHRNPVCIVLIFLFLGCGGDYSGWPFQTGARKAYPMSFAVPAVIAGSVYLVCEDPFRIVPGTHGDKIDCPKRLYRPEFIADLAKNETDRRDWAKIARAGGYSARVIEGLLSKRRKENETE